MSLRLSSTLNLLLASSLIGVLIAVAYEKQVFREDPAVIQTVTGNPSNNISVQRETADIVFFYLPGCPACKQAEELLDRAETHHPELTVVRVATDTDEGRKSEEELGEKYKIPQIERHLVPALFLKKGGFIAEAQQIAAALSFWLPASERPENIPMWKPCMNDREGCHD
jgi:glutaredoxin